MKLTKEQTEAVAEALAYARTPTQPYYTIGGLAGTGKTTILAELCRELVSGFVVGCPTGKAASVLRSKGISADTIHALAYACQGHDKHGKLQFDWVGLEKKEENEGAGLLLVDEASMVSQRTLDDLLSACIPIIFVGDFGQLPPIMGDPKLLTNLDCELKEIHRQKDHLLVVCYAFRERNTVGRHFTEHPEVARYATLGSSDARKWQEECDVLLAQRNGTRFAINYQRLLDILPAPTHPGALPEDRAPLVKELIEADVYVPVCCMSNNREYGIYNGECGWIKPKEDYKDGLFLVEWFDDEPFGEEKGEDIICTAKAFYTPPGTVNFREDGLQVDFGWCLTVHKAQGSEWDHVGVIDEGQGRMSDDDYARWRYTAATRAKKRLSWFGNRKR